MASATLPSRPVRVNSEVAEMAPSRYEQVSGMMTAILMLIGMLTFMMFIIWLSSRLVWEVPIAKVKVLEDVGGGGSGSTMTGGDQDLQEPSPEEMPEITEQKVEQSLESISSIVTTEVLVLDAIGGATGFGNGEGTGTGDGRGPGPGGPGTSDGIPAWERWELRFDVKNLTTYAQMLDFFKVELGIAGGGIERVDYASNLSAARPTTRQGSPKDEKRIRFLYKSGDLRQADRALAQKGGISTDGRIVFQFYTPEMYTQLLTLENEKMGSHRIIEVRKTVFGVRGDPGKWQFYVISQDYRSVPTE